MNNGFWSPDDDDVSKPHLVVDIINDMTQLIMSTEKSHTIERLRKLREEFENIIKED